MQTATILISGVLEIDVQTIRKCVLRPMTCGPHLNQALCWILGRSVSAPREVPFWAQVAAHSDHSLLKHHVYCALKYLATCPFPLVDCEFR